MKTVLPEIRLVRQRLARDCEVAAVAMILGKTYEEVVAPYEMTEDRAKNFVPEHEFGKHRIAWCRIYKSWGGEWPPKPFAEVHYCSVEVNDPSPCSHAVVMLANGDVLDPLTDERKRLTDYAKVNFVAGIARLEMG